MWSMKSKKQYFHWFNSSNKSIKIDRRARFQCLLHVHTRKVCLQAPAVPDTKLNGPTKNHCVSFLRTLVIFCGCRRNVLTRLTERNRDISPQLLPSHQSQVKMRVSLFYSLAFVTAVAAEQCGDTTLHCFGDSIPCMAGDADFAFHPKDPFGETFFFLKTTSQDGWYCDCPDNLTGLRCAREYEECRGTDHFCYHGGKCITDLNATVSDSELFCDCSEAMHNSMPYRGKFCEVELERCTHDSEVFCANNGQCKDDFANKLRPCECSSAFRGPHCEFDDGHVPNCNLVCENNGECARGIKTYSTALHNDFFARHDGEFQYCDCQDGFYGLKCEAAATDCGDAQCFHGGACVETENSKNETIFACDCSDAKSGGVSYAGQYCQSPSVKNCGDKGANGQLFCTNGGECKADA